MSGRKNVYLCPECGHGFVTEQLDAGVTPFMTGCLTCNGVAQSLMYGVSQEVLASITPAMEWYLPKGEELQALSQTAIQNIERGILVGREVPR